jgi:Fe-S cluster assembly ATP-binding protein
VFLAFQYPVEIPGVSNTYFLKAALNADAQAPRAARARRPPVPEARAREGEARRHGRVAAPAAGERGLLGRREEAQRDLPDGVLEPSSAILDETDSGLDIDALKIVADGVNALRGQDRAFVVITHYQRSAQLHRARLRARAARRQIVKSGGKELALELEQKGYAWLEESVGAPA